MNSRRDFLKKSSLLGLAGIAGNLISNNQLNKLENLGEVANQNNQAFKLPALPYAYDALEPFIDKQTMEIHHTKHHQAYVDKLNATPSTNIDYQSTDQIKCTHIDNTTSSLIRNNLGGHYNHSLFWTLLMPNPEGKPNTPSVKLAAAINTSFTNFDEFKKQFSEKAATHFGSGWCWLVYQKGKIVIETTVNQDNPLMRLNLKNPLEPTKYPILALDVWEHAYYLKYQNKRKDYIENFWKIVNWQQAEKLFLEAEKL